MFDSSQVLLVFPAVTERPGELRQQASETPVFDQWGNAVAVVADIVFVQDAFVGEYPVELGRKLEILAPRHFVDPQSGKLRPQRAIERRVDFDDRKVAGEVSRFVEAARAGRWINDALPVLIRPAGGPYFDVVSHARYLSLFIRLPKV